MDDPTSLDLTEILGVDDTVLRSTGSSSFGVTSAGFLPKPFTRLLAERIALARQVIDPDLDLSSGSIVRKLLEITALEDARTWKALASSYDDAFVSSARGRALSDLGAELGIERPFLTASGSLVLTLAGTLPAGSPTLTLPSGARLGTPGGHRVALATPVTLSADRPTATVPATSFDPGPDGNLDPAIVQGTSHPQAVDRWEIADTKLADLVAADVAAGLSPDASATGAGLVRITHTVAFTGGSDQWDDDRYRALLLAAPRSIWTPESIAATVTLVPGVRQVVVRDGWGGLDLNQSIFGDFTFMERLFAADRDISSPYFVTVLVAPTEAAIWDGRNGVRAAVEEAIRDVRPVGVFPDIVRAEQVFVAVQADVLTRGLPLPAGSVDSVNSSPAAVALKDRMIGRLHRVVDSLLLSEPVRCSAVTAAVMAEPGVADVVHLRLVRFPRMLDRIGSTMEVDVSPQVLNPNENLNLAADQVAVLIEAPGLLTVRSA